MFGLVLMLAEIETPTWGTIGLVSTLLAGVPSTLLVWLHVRVAGIGSRMDNEIQRLDSKIVEQRSDFYAHLAANYFPKGELVARIETLNTSLRGLETRVGDFIGLIERSDSQLAQVSERQAKSEVKIENLENR